MIISHKHKLIFVRPSKTGSSSAQATIVNSGMLGPEDLYTGWRNGVLETPTESKGFNNITCSDIRKVSPHTIPKNLYVDESGPYPLLGHLTPSEAVRLKVLTEEQLLEYKTISILRHPFERFLSAWFFGRKLQDLPNDIYSLEKQIQYNISEITNPYLGKWQIDYITYENKILPNAELIPYEHLNDSLKIIIENCGGTISKNQYRLKNQYRPDWSRPHYMNWLSLNSVNYVDDYITNDWLFYLGKPN